MENRWNKFSKYNSKETEQSKYCYKDTDILINKEGIKDAEALAEFEADITLIRQYELEKEQRIIGRFGIAHIKKIHAYIFQDVYSFAGKFRDENINKGSTEFCKSQFIELNLKTILDELKRDKFLKGLNVEEFSQRASYYLSEINMIHPFREGNGRSIREFFRQLALYCGYIIDWSLVDKEKLLDATIISVEKNYEPLVECINQIIIKQL